MSSHELAVLASNDKEAWAELKKGKAFCIAKALAARKWNQLTNIL